MENVYGFLIMVAVVAAGWFYVTKIKLPRDKALRELEDARSRAESKVKMSDPILRADIEVLERSGSLYAEEAIHLRRQQIERGLQPGA